MKKAKISSTKKDNLADIQKYFVKAISNPLNPKYKSAEKINSGGSFKKIAKKLIKPNDRLTSFERLEIYNRQYWFRLMECLEQDFSGLKALLGNKKFNQLAVAYIQKHKSKSYTLRNLGQFLPDFIKKNKKLCGSRYEICKQAVALEWAQIEAFDKAGKAVISPEKLAKKNPEKLKLKIRPYMTLLELDYPLDDFLISLRKDNQNRSEAGSEKAPEKSTKAIKLPNKQKTYVVVHRFQNKVYFKKLDKAGFVILAELAKGKNLGSACSKGVKYLPKGTAPEKIESIIFEYFSVWNSLGWFCY